MQLLAIEMAYNIKIQNKEEVARILAAGSGDKSDVLMACSFISWGYELALFCSEMVLLHYSSNW